MIWKNWDDAKRASFIRLTGLMIAAFTIFAILSCVSYLIHWKEDMSYLSDPALMDSVKKVHNIANKMGLRFSHFVISSLFGLGSFALLLFLAGTSARLIAQKWAPSLTKTLLVSVSGTLILSVSFAYLGMILQNTTIFGGGLGGDFGAWVTDCGYNLFGSIVLGIFLTVIILIWLFLSSKKFTRWFSELGKKKEVISADDILQESMGESASTLSEDGGNAIPETTAVAEEEEETTKKTKALTPKIIETEDVKPDGEFEIIEDNTLTTTVKEPLKPIDNRMDPPEGLPKFNFPPPLKLLNDYSEQRTEVSKEELTRNNNKIRSTLANYKIQVKDVRALVGASVTLYKVYPAEGVQIAQIRRLQEDIALSLNAKGVRVVTLNDSVGIEVANDRPSTVPLKALLNDSSFRESKAELPVALGYTITQEVKTIDLADAPHLLIAGATKQGKSVCLNVIVNSLLYSKHPSELKFVFIDPKMVEFSAYSGLVNHYLAVLPEAGDDRNHAIIKNAKDADKALRALCVEMDERYELLCKSGVNKITLYNEKYKQHHLRSTEGHRFLPYIVCVVDEYADLTMTTGASPEARAASKSITCSIIRLAQKGRAAGIHVILATQRPSVDVISGIIKSNFPMRIAFRVAARVDSQTIIDGPGAEKLIGRGDMLFSAGIESERIQCGLINGDEIDSVTKYVSDQQGYAKSYNAPYYLPEVSEGDSDGSNGGGLTDMKDIDNRFKDAAELVVTYQKASTSYLQTMLGMGFAKSARVMQQLEAAGIVGPQEGSKPRAVLVPDLNSLQSILDAYIK